MKSVTLPAASSSCRLALPHSAKRKVNFSVGVGLSRRQDVRCYRRLYSSHLILPDPQGIPFDAAARRVTAYVHSHCWCASVSQWWIHLVKTFRYPRSWRCSSMVELVQPRVVVVPALYSTVAIVKRSGQKRVYSANVVRECCMEVDEDLPTRRRGIDRDPSSL